MSTQYAPEVLSASTITGDSVVNLQGEDLGHIKDLMIEVPNGRIAYAVLSFGGFMGVGDKLFAVPWSALKVDTENRRFVLDAAKERLKKAPGFDKEHWPKTEDRTWQSDVHKFYRTKPYWEETDQYTG